MESMTPQDLDRLLADTAFVRRIARSLVRDPDAADDLAQDALVVALERPPREGTSLRGWIATVVRTLAIDRARGTAARARRETSAAAPQHALGPDEIATRLDMSQHVARALRELEEPYRTALYLRYVEDLDPPTIAARLELPIATVKTRLRRGLEMLRRRFDREWGGRDAWSAALLPLSVDVAPSAPIAGTLLMTTGAKIAAALLVCGVAAWVMWPEASIVEPAGGPVIASTNNAGLATPAQDAAERKVAAGTDTEAASIGESDASKSKAGPFVRVLDPRRFPVAGAHVVLHVPGFGDDETTTDAEGIARFVRLPGLESEKRSASVLAWDDGGLAGARACFVKAVGGSTTASDAETSRHLGEVLLGSGVPSLTVRVEEDGRPAPGARVVLEIGAYPVAIADATTGSDGRARFENVPAKSILVRATNASRAGRTASVLASDRAAEIVVALQPTRTIEVTVVDKETRAPIAGARVAVQESFHVTDDGEMGSGYRSTFFMNRAVELSIPPTNGEGETRVVGLPSLVNHQIEAAADGYLGPQAPTSPPWIPTASNSITLELESRHERSARWPLEAGEVDSPPQGTMLKLRAATIDVYGLERSVPLPVNARIEGGAVVADRVLDGMWECYAVAPDGSIARLWIAKGAAEGGPTSFRRPRRVDVKVLDTEGLPARGIEIELKNQGNNRLLPPKLTDELGEVTFEGLWGWRTQVCAGGDERGIVDLDKGDGRLEVRLPVSRQLTLRLRVDGAPGLPSKYSVTLGRGTRVLSEDPASGLVRVQYAEEDKAASVGVSAPGYLTSSTEFDASSTDVVEVDLRCGGSLLAHVLPPKSARVRLRCEVWNVATNDWQTQSAHHVSDERFAPNAPDGGYLFRGLQPGRYRVRDIDAGRSSEAVDVVPGTSPSEVDLDLSHVIRIRGVIETPAGTPARGALVVVEGEGVASHEPTWLKGTETAEGHYADKDGRFQLTIDTSKPVTLRAAHPYLSPDPKLGSVVVRGDEQEVRLVLVAGDEVQIPLEAFGDLPPRDLLRIYAYRGEPDGEPHAWFRAVVVDGVARFSGLERGTWTLWMDSRYAYAPFVLRGVEVGAGVTRVEPQVTLGSSLRVRVLGGSGTATPHVYVSAHKTSEPTVLRDRNANGEELVVVTGIGAGSYTVRMSIGERHPVERTIEFDGTSDVEIDFDVRDPKQR